jgi:hypothetical protein
MATLNQLRTRTRRYLRETDAATSFWSEDFLDQIINFVYRRRSSQLIMAYEGWFVLVASRDIEANKDTYAFPTNFSRLHKLELVRSDGRSVPIQRNERHSAVKSSEGGADDTYLPNYRPLGNGFILEPGPQTTVTNGIKLEYAGTPVELSADGDNLHPSFPQLFEELIVLDAAIIAFDAEGNHETGMVRSLLRARSELEFDWERFIDQRVVSRSRVDEFIPHYADA